MNIIPALSGTPLWDRESCARLCLTSLCALGALTLAEVTVELGPGDHKPL